MKKGYLKNIEMFSTWEKEKKRKMQEVTTGIKEKGINNMEWIDREEWRRKIKHKAQKQVITLILYT